MDLKVLSLTEVSLVCRISKTTIWRLQSIGQFPSPIKLSKRRIGWYEQDIINWLKLNQKESVL